MATRSRSFPTRTEAHAWAAIEEAAIHSSGASANPPPAGMTLGDILLRYEEVITPTKRSAATEKSRLAKMRTDRLASVRLRDLSSIHFADYRDRRLAVAKPATVRRELAMVQHALNTARIDWGISPRGNPIRDIRLPKLDNARDRRMEGDEFDRLIAALPDTDSNPMRRIVILAIETGMRRGELLNLRWEHINLPAALAHIPETKTGRPRTIPLTTNASRVLTELLPSARGPVFMMTGNAVRLAWNRATARAGIAGLRFHDLRHEAISSFFELGLSLPEVAVISGHRDPRMLMRYTHLRPEEVGVKMRKLAAG